MPQKVLVTGGAGFIGSNLVDALVATGASVTVFDDLSSGRLEFIQGHVKYGRVKFVKGSILDRKALDAAMQSCGRAFHLAATPDVRAGTEKPQAMFNVNMAGTFNAIDAARSASVGEFVFASSATVYGEASVIPTPENYSPLRPISLYGATKLAGEAMLSGVCGVSGMKAVAYRFANVIGRRGTHGVIRDFILKMRRNPKELEILGNGKQKKNYVHVDDCVAGILHPKKGLGKFETLNIGSADSITVTEIADIIAEEMGLHNVKYSFTGGDRGWVGDVPKYQPAIDSMLAQGWKPKMNSEQAVRKAVKELITEI